MKTVQLIAFTNMMILLFFTVTTTIAATVATSLEGWTKTSDGPFSKREGLMGVSYKGNIFLSAGRETFGVGFSNELWTSTDGGRDWEQVNYGPTPFPKRAYHTHVVLGDCMYIMGGQTFFTFYNDVWKSCDGDGKVWEQVTEHAPWQGRAGLSAVVTSGGEIIVAGGCYNKNNNPAARSFFGDVWASSDGGRTWEQRTPNAAWIARSGPRLIEDKTGKLLIIAGEIGFTPSTQLVDIWSSADGGVTWQIVSEQPGFSERSGHGVVVTPKHKDILVIAGWPHLHDAWISQDNGVSFTQIANDVWNCGEDKCGKFDFWPLIHDNKLVTIGGSAAYTTFGTLFQDTWTADIIEADNELVVVEEEEGDIIEADNELVVVEEEEGSLRGYGTKMLEIAA